ncbi:FkbM family methyltransferase [Streptomyces albicerus]|uniref:FkbM family methyltransferase n=1 Tax=Streptomyces albicerus TaxID=2569859 RepID=UPI001CED9512|nr:FkbM family methyltransferase [Streptomyces albicerus]
MTRGKGRYAVTAAGADAWLVARGTAGRKVKAVPFGDTGARLLLEKAVSAESEREFQLGAAHYLCAQHVAAVLEKYRVNCVFDVGANTGQYGKGLRRFGYTGRIVSFEPVSDTFERLQRSAESDPDWQVYNFALGREEAVQSIHIDWKSMNSLLPPSEYGKERYKRFAKGRTEEIEIRRLDDVMQKALEGIDDPRPYLKMDTQGFDMEVFAGAGERISEFVGMQSEVAALRLYEGSPAMGEAIAAYEEAGFGVTGMYPVTREPATGRVVEFDCVMVRPEAVPLEQ